MNSTYSSPMAQLDNRSRTKATVGIMIAIMFLFLLMQYQLVFLYYDDYGYQSLTYAVDLGDDIQPTLIKSIRYTIKSYQTVNGRIFTNFLLACSASLGGIKTMRVVMPIVLMAIYMLIINLHKSASDLRLIEITIATLMLHGVFTMQTAAYGLYWFAAAYGYVIPTMLFMLLVTIYKKNGKCLPLLCIVLCLSSEQAVAMTLVWIVGNMIWDVTHRTKISYISVVCLVLSIVASMVLVLSPASQARMSSDSNLAFSGMKILDKLSQNVTIIVETMLYRNGKIWPIYYLTVIILLSGNLAITSQGKWKKIAHGVFTFLTGIFIILSIEYDKIDKSQMTYNIFFLYFVLSFVELIIYGINKADRTFAVAAISGGASVALLLLMPEIPGRTFIPIIFLTGFFAARVISYADKNIEKVIVLCCNIAFVLFSGNNLITTYEGYKTNAKVLLANECRMIEMSDRLASGEEVDVIELYKVPYHEYCGQMPYFEGLEFMTYWMDNYYHVPYKTQYIWYEYPSGDNPTFVNIIPNE